MYNPYCKKVSITNRMKQFYATTKTYNSDICYNFRNMLIFLLETVLNTYSKKKSEFDDAIILT